MDKTVKEIINDVKSMDVAKSFTYGASPVTEEPTVVDYVKSVIDKIETLYELPFRIVDGKKEYFSHQTVSAEQLKLKLFVKAISYNKEICDVLLDDRNESLRKEILSLNLGYLAIHANGFY